MAVIGTAIVLGLLAERVLDTGIRIPGIGAAAGLLGLYLGAWLWARLAEAGEDDRWQERAVEGLIEDVLRARRRLARLALEGAAARSLGKVQDLIRDLRAAPRTSLAALQVVVRELRRAAERE